MKFLVIMAVYLISVLVILLLLNPQFFPTNEEKTVKNQIRQAVATLGFFSLEFLTIIIIFVVSRG